MVLNAYAVSVAEYLRERQGRRLRRQVSKKDMTVLPHYSPGYEGWELHDQATLFDAIEEHGPLRLLPSGRLQPGRSALAVFGITKSVILASELNDYWLHQRNSRTRGETGVVTESTRYAFPQSTLEKWGHERLVVEKKADGGLLARFRFDGTTCSSLGLPLAFDYAVALGAKTDKGRRILESSCRPTENNLSYRSMCGYLADPDRMIAVLAENPLVGQQLDEAIGEPGETSSSGCLCLETNRKHKWSVVLETIHYWLAHQKD